MSLMAVSSRLTRYCQTVILVNRVTGTPIVEDKPFNLITNYLELTSSEEADEYLNTPWTKCGIYSGRDQRYYDQIL